MAKRKPSTGFSTARRTLYFSQHFFGRDEYRHHATRQRDECVQWHTPMFLKGVPEFNKPLLRQSEAAMGPGSFLLPEDVTIASRNRSD